MDAHSLPAALASHFAPLHTKQRSAYAALITAVVFTHVVGIAALGRAYCAERQVAKPRHVIKGFDALLSNDRVPIEALWAAWAMWLLVDATRVTIVFDWTSLQRDRVRVLWVGLVTDDGHCIPLFALPLLGRRKGRLAVAERKAIARLRTLIPLDVHVTVLADRGFDGQYFRACLAAHAFHYVLRLRSNLWIRVKNRAYRAKTLVPPPGEPARKYDDVAVTADRLAVPHLVTYQAADKDEAWILITDLDITAEDAVVCYGGRAHIEAMFRDIKCPKFGMGLDDVPIEREDRLTRMIIVVSIGYTITRRVGQLAAAEDLGRHFSTSGRGPERHSTFSLGRFHVKASPHLLAQAASSLNSLGFCSPP